MTINIYLSTKTQDLLKETQKKYHVSISTIAQIITNYVKPNILEYGHDILNTYIDKDHRNKTSIKPSNLKETDDFFKKINFSKETASHIYSNLLYLFANEMWMDLFNNEIKSSKDLNKHIKDINKELANKKEIFWNYNNRLRETVRIVRKEKDYFQRILS